MKPQDYEVDIRPLGAADGGGYLAIAPELPGCKSDGEMPQAAQELGRQIPLPRRAAA